MRVVLYARVSTVKQAEKNLSNPDQLRQLRDYCKKNKHEIVREYCEEGASATDDCRVEFQAMMDDITSKTIECDLILVLTTSRFYRDAVGAGNWKRTLKKYGVKVVAINQNIGDVCAPTANLIETIFAAVDQHDSEMIGLHTTRGMKENARRGYFNGARPPYGYLVEQTDDEKGVARGHLVPNKDEARIVQRIFTLYTVDCIGSLEIAKRLNKDKVPYRNDRGWIGKQVLRVLENEVYIGQHIFNRYDKKLKQERPREEWLITEVPSIVSEEVFEAACARRKANAPEIKIGRVSTGEPVLSGLLRCGICGAQMVSSITCKKGKDGESISYPYYTCWTYKHQGKDACPGCRLPMKAAEHAIIEEVLDKAFSKQNVLNLVKEVRRSLAESERPVRAIRKELDEVEKKLQRYYDAFESGAMDPELVGDRVKILTADKHKFKAELAKRTAIHELPASIASDENIAKIQEQLRSIIAAASPGGIREYLNIILDKIIVNGNSIEIHGFSAGVMATLAVNIDENTGSVTRVRAERDKWQPVGDSNPCDGTENPAS